MSQFIHSVTSWASSRKSVEWLFSVIPSSNFIFMEKGTKRSETREITFLRII